VTNGGSGGAFASRSIISNRYLNLKPLVAANGAAGGQAKAGLCRLDRRTASLMPLIQWWN
jgi:hypothetical protein